MDPELYEEWSEAAVELPPVRSWRICLRGHSEGCAGSWGGCGGGGGWQVMSQSVEGQVFLQAMGVEAVLSIVMTVLGVCTLWWTFCRRKAQSLPGGAEQGRGRMSTASSSRMVGQASVLPTVVEEGEELDEVVQGPGCVYGLRSKNNAQGGGEDMDLSYSL